MERAVAWVLARSAPGFGGMRRSFSVEDVAAAMHPEAEPPVHDPATALYLKRAAKAGLLVESNPRLLPKRYTGTVAGDRAYAERP